MESEEEWSFQERSLLLHSFRGNPSASFFFTQAIQVIPEKWKSSTGDKQTSPENLRIWFWSCNTLYHRVLRASLLGMGFISSKDSHVAHRPRGLLFLSMQMELWCCRGRKTKATSYLLRNLLSLWLVYNSCVCNCILRRTFISSVWTFLLLFWKTSSTIDFYII